MALKREDMKDWITHKSQQVIISICNTIQNQTLDSDAKQNLYVALHEELKILLFIHDRLEDWSEELVDKFAANPEKASEFLANIP